MEALSGVDSLVIQQQKEWGKSFPVLRPKTNTP